MNELSIIIPCTQTTDVVPAFLDELSEFLLTNPGDMDVIVVASDPSDRLAALVRYGEERYPWMQLRALERFGSARRFGALARFGIAYSTSRYAAIVSPYGDDDLTALPKMLKELRGGAQVAQATRFATPEHATRLPWRFRMYQRVYRVLVRWVLGHVITDSTYGYKMFDRVFVVAIGLTQNGYAICPEITLKALLARGRVAHVPSVAKPARATSSFSLLREGPGYAWLLVRGLAHRVGLPWF
ncbi:MAG: hypothetical protein Q7S96_02215 [bacterium]|nr:hypothetical protein [bacterium]